MEPNEDNLRVRESNSSITEQSYPLMLTISQFPRPVEPTERRAATQMESGNGILITHKEIAEILGYSHDFVMAALRRGDIPARKVGGRWIISRATFFRWLEGQ